MKILMGRRELSVTLNVIIPTGRTDRSVLFFYKVMYFHEDPNRQNRDMRHS